MGDAPGEESWESWKTVQKLAALDKYVAQTKGLKTLSHTRTLKMQNRDRAGDARRATEKRRGDRLGRVVRAKS